MVCESMIKEAQIGDNEAIEKIFQNYKRFIFAKTKEYFLYGGEKDDLIQEGMIGLFKAIAAFDSNKNASFNTFASLCIKRQIVSAIKSHNAGKNKFLNEAETAHEETGTYNYSGGKKTFDNYNPEEMFLCKERIGAFKKFRVENFSKLENQVFEEMLKGQNYIEIANNLEKGVKNIDNTIQRIKKKYREFEQTYLYFAN